MKLSVTQENLSRALGTVSRVASSRGSLPILSNVLLKTIDNQLHIAATNLDVAISETIGAKVSQEGAITVPARLMQDYIGSLPNATLNLQVKDSKLTISTDHHTSTINGTPADDFPVMPTVEKPTTFTLTAGVLKQTLQKVLFAASNDEARPVLTGVFMHTHEGSLYAVATDSYRLAECRVTKLDADVSLLLPASSLQDVLRVIRDESSEVEVNFDEQQATVQVGSVELVTRLIDGSYPDYRRLLPKTHETTATVKRDDLQEITKVSSLFAREAAGGVTVTVSEDDQEVSITSIASQVGENNAVAKADVKGDATITMNSRYVLDALQAFETDKVVVGVNGKLDPCLFSSPEDKDYLHIVMPVKS